MLADLPDNPGRPNMTPDGSMFWVIAQGGALVVILFSFLWDQFKVKPADREERGKFLSGLDSAIDKLTASHNTQIMAILDAQKTQHEATLRKLGEQHSATLEKTETMLKEMVGLFNSESGKTREWVIQEFRLNQTDLKEIATAIQSLAREMSEARGYKPARGPKRDET